MRYKPFETFCRNYFVDSSGKLQDAKGNSKEAKKRRVDRRHNRLIHELRTLQSNLNSLYKSGQEARSKNSEVVKVQRIFRQAGEIRKKVMNVKNELRKLRR